MITPNKIITIDESVLGKLGVILRAGPEKTDAVSLYRKVSDKFESIDQFLLALDTLYILGKIDIDFSAETLTYAA